jgi:hypothetical protein
MERGLQRGIVTNNEVSFSVTHICEKTGNLHNYRGKGERKQETGTIEVFSTYNK